MRIALVNAPLSSIVCDHGIGHQMPLGLLMIGGPLRAAGHDVSLIDAGAERLAADVVAARVIECAADIVMVGHTGSTSAHPSALGTLRAIKRAAPDAFTVYGGVYPTYHAQEIVAHEPAVDAVVRGEGELTVVDLVRALAHDGDLTAVDGLVWRRDGEVIVNRARPPLADLDATPVGYDLIADWDRYRAFGWGRAAGVQFSRGCPHTCTYCGQWMFWRQWRHRDPARVAADIEHLHRDHDVRFLWLADENPTTDQALWRELLERIAALRLPIAMCASLRAQDVVRDAEFLHLYREAGFLYVLMGIETVDDAVFARVRKGSDADDARRAIVLLREHGILSIVDYMFGLEEESWRSVWRGLRGLLRYDGDFVNALYLTPHDWTPLGRELRDAAVVEPDLWRWDYRHQVLATRHMSPRALFIAVKLVELLYHLRPKMLWRLAFGRDARSRRQLRWGWRQAAGVFFAELRERRRAARPPQVPLTSQPRTPGADSTSTPEHAQATAEQRRREAAAVRGPRR